SDGSAVAYLTGAQPGGGANDPQLSSSGEEVFYVQGAGTCASALHAVTVGGNHQTRTVATPDIDYGISGYAVGPVPSSASGSTRPALAYFEQSCNGASPAAKLVMTDASGQRRVIKFA